MGQQSVQLIINYLLNHEDQKKVKDKLGQRSRIYIHPSFTVKQIYQKLPNDTDFSVTPSASKMFDEMRVHMDCAGCESKVKSALQRVKGVDDIEIDMAMQKVTVTGWADQVLKAVRKTGRRAELWQLPYSPAEHQSYYNQHQCNGPVSYHAPQPSSSYNYYKHGYDSQNPNYYHYPVHPSIFNHQTGSSFSDENPHACSIM